jgi:hypothetical protein
MDPDEKRFGSFRPYTIVETDIVDFNRKKENGDAYG